MGPRRIGRILVWQVLILLQPSSSIIQRHASTHGSPADSPKPAHGNWLYISDFIQ
jgi:hypothetical protein